MAGPFDYTVQSPQNAFQSAYAFGQNIAAQQQAQQQAQLKAQQAAQAKQAMQMVYDNPTPENVSKFYMAYPEYKEQFESARKPLTDAAKADDLDFSSRAMILLSNDKTEEADRLLQDRITALKNTPGKEQEAAATEAIAKAIKADPKMGRQIFGMKIAAADPDLYKTVFAQADMTGFQKDLLAAGIDPNSEQGKAKAAEYVGLKVDPIVQMPTPSGGQFVGKQSEYYRMFGQNAPAPQPKELPKVGEVRNGYRFNGGDPANKSNWSKGDAGSNASGGFRPSGGAG